MEDDWIAAGRMEGSGGYTKECKVRTTTSTNPLPPRPSTSYSLLAAPPSPVRLSSSAVIVYLRNPVPRIPPTSPAPPAPPPPPSPCNPPLPLSFLLCRRLQRIIIQGDTAPRLPLIVSRALARSLARSRARPRARVSTPGGTFLPRSSVQVRERRPEVFSLFARELKASRRGKVRGKRDNLRVVTGGGRAPNSAPPPARESLRFPVMFDIKGWGHFAR